MKLPERAHLNWQLSSSSARRADRDALSCSFVLNDVILGTGLRFQN